MNIIKDDDFDEALNHLSKDFEAFNSKNNTHQHLGDELSQRQKERQIRETLQSRHGPTAELHDQVNITEINYRSFNNKALK